MRSEDAGDLFFVMDRNVSQMNTNTDIDIVACYGYAAALFLSARTLIVTWSPRDSCHSIFGSLDIG